MPVEKIKYWVSYAITIGLIYAILLILSIRDFQQNASGWAAPLFLIALPGGLSTLTIYYSKNLLYKGIAFYVLFLDVAGIVIAYG